LDCFNIRLWHIVIEDWHFLIFLLWFCLFYISRNLKHITI
jgi:hypothetical protein